jgi:autophagy-related protein 27
MIILSSFLPLQIFILSASFWISSSYSFTVGQEAFDCKNVRSNNYQFDLSRFNFPVELIDSEKTHPTTTETSIKIDLCAPLPLDNGPANEQCEKGTRICMKVTNKKEGETDRVTQVISAGGNGMDEGKWSVQLGEHVDGAERVLELEMPGEYYGDRKQRTEIDFRCSKNGSKDAKPILKKYDREEGKLKLEWTTPYACTTHMGGAGDNDSDNTDKGGDKNSNKSSGGWGFFSWFFFLLIIGGIIYFAAGLWRNYNEYGVIELPNKDFWREAPYIAKDMGKHIYSTVSGQGSSRGAYEPV